MPYVSDKQRRYMHSQLPQIAERWDREYGGGTKNGSLRAAAERHMTHGRTPAKLPPPNATPAAPKVVSRQSPGSVPPKKRGSNG